MSKECADCGNERIMLCPFCEHDFSEASKQKDAELATLREAVEVLGRECKAWQDWYRTPANASYALRDAAIDARNANPTARAAVEDKG